MGSRRPSHPKLVDVTGMGVWLVATVLTSLLVSACSTEPDQPVAATASTDEPELELTRTPEPGANARDFALALSQTPRLNSIRRAAPATFDEVASTSEAVIDGTLDDVRLEVTTLPIPPEFDDLPANPERELQHADIVIEVLVTTSTDHDTGAPGDVIDIRVPFYLGAVNPFSVSDEPFPEAAMDPIHDVAPIGIPVTVFYRQAMSEPPTDPFESAGLDAMAGVIMIEGQDLVSLDAAVGDVLAWSATTSLDEMRASADSG